jgi:hypothetical protein
LFSAVRLRSRHLLTYLLLATYAGIAFLGEGLHELMPEAGHHRHHGLAIVHCADDHCCDHEEHAAHDNDHHAASGLASLTVNSHADSHLCEICQFLFQAISQPASVAPPIDWQPLVVANPQRPQQLLHSPVSLGPHAPRGPPLLLG